MQAPKRFGLSGKARGRIYYLLGFFLFTALFWANEHKFVILGMVLCLCLWSGFVDGVNTRGERTFFGFKKERAGKYIKSVFGRDLDD
jgi:hypothetical protein